MSLNVCRACLGAGHKDADNVRMHSVNDGLLGLYEKLAGVKMDTGEGKCSLCYICYSQLQRCFRFSEMAHKSEKYLEFISKTKVTMKILNLGSKQTLAVKILEPTSLDGINDGKSIKHNYKIKQKKLRNTSKKDKYIKFPSQEMGTAETVPGLSYELNSITEANLSEDILTLDKNLYILEDITISNNNLIYKDVPNKEYATENYEDTILIEEYVDGHENDYKNGQSTHNMTTNKKNADEDVSTKEYVTGKYGDTIEEYVSEDITVACNNLDEHEHDNMTANEENADENVHEEYLDEDLIQKEDIILYVKDNVKKSVSKKKIFRPSNFMCEICGKTSYSRGHHEQHMRVHTGERFYCKICNKGFTQEGSLERHTRNHIGLTPYVCHVCGKAFKERSGVNWHILYVHNKYRPYACEVCDKRFPKRDSLKSHMVTHTGPTQEYKCGKCNIQLGSYTSLRRHIKDKCCEKEKKQKFPSNKVSKSKTKKVTNKKIEI